MHAKFNRLALAYAPIKDRVKNLQCIVKEHILSIEPQLLAASHLLQREQRTISPVALQNLNKFVF